jgi:Fe-S-cluster containining protein
MSGPCDPDNCGSACCSPVMLPYTKAEFLLMNQSDERQRDWVMNDLTRIPASEGYRRSPWYRAAEFVNQFGEPTTPVFYECRHFDAVGNRCTDYENRPDACAGFPRYGAPVTDPATCLPPTCGYRADLGEPVVLRGRGS